MNKTNLIAEDHPSFGCQQAWFLFSVTPPGMRGAGRLLLVEAKNVWAVQTLERLTNSDNTVSRTCNLVAVFRNCDDVGIRSDLMDEISYVDFVIDMVDMDRLLSDSLSSSGFASSLTADEKAHAAKRLYDAPNPEDGQPEPVQQLKANFLPPKDDVQASKSDCMLMMNGGERLSSALTGLGFKGPSVKKFIDSLGNRVMTDPIEVLLKEGIRALTSS